MRAADIFPREVRRKYNNGYFSEETIVKSKLKRVKYYNTRGHVSTVVLALPELTYHMGSHSFPCHLTKVPAITPAEAGTQFIDSGRMKS